MATVRYLWTAFTRTSIVVAPDERGNYDKSRRSAQHLRRQRSTEAQILEEESLD
jgi:hypothetical protein